MLCQCCIGRIEFIYTIVGIQFNGEGNCRLQYDSVICNFSHYNPALVYAEYLAY